MLKIKLKNKTKQKKRMIIKIVKVNLGLIWWCCGQCGVSSFSDSSLVWLIFLKIYTSKAVPSVLASAVCWSRQCLFSALTQGERWWTLFFFLLTCSVALWGGRDAANK